MPSRWPHPAGGLSQSPSACSRCHLREGRTWRWGSQPNGLFVGERANRSSSSSKASLWRLLMTRKKVVKHARGRLRLASKRVSCLFSHYASLASRISQRSFLTSRRDIAPRRSTTRLRGIIHILEASIHRLRPIRSCTSVAPMCASGPSSFRAHALERQESKVPSQKPTDLRF